MSQDEINRIKAFLHSLNLHPIYLEHQAVITSQDAAATRGFELKQGIKALLFTNETDWVIVDVPADKKVDTKKVIQQLGWSKSKIRMATPEEVLSKTGCEIGAVPPFGHKETISLLVDLNIYQNQESAFNIGLRTHSLKIPTSEMKQVFTKLNAIEGIFSK